MNFFASWTARIMLAEDQDATNAGVVRPRMHPFAAGRCPRSGERPPRTRERGSRCRRWLSSVMPRSDQPYLFVPATLELCGTARSMPSPTAASHLGTVSSARALPPCSAIKTPRVDPLGRNTRSSRREPAGARRNLRSHSSTTDANSERSRRAARSSARSQSGMNQKPARRPSCGERRAAVDPSRRR